MNSIGRVPGFVWACVWLLILQACATQPLVQPGAPAGVAIEGMIIRNDLPYPVTEAMINVPATGAFAGCGNIMPGTDCRTSFETVNYSGNAMVVSWKEYGQEKSTKEFVVKPGSDLDTGMPVWLEVTIFVAGQAGAKFVKSRSGP